MLFTTGALMMIAWVACASIGIVMARYYKEVWPNSTLCSQKVWFTVSAWKLTMILSPAISARTPILYQAHGHLNIAKFITKGSGLWKSSNHVCIPPKAHLGISNA